MAGPAEPGWPGRRAARADTRARCEDLNRSGAGPLERPAPVNPGHGPASAAPARHGGRGVGYCHASCSVAPSPWSRCRPAAGRRRPLASPPRTAPSVAVPEYARALLRRLAGAAPVSGGMGRRCRCHLPDAAPGTGRAPHRSRVDRPGPTGTGAGSLASPLRPRRRSPGLADRAAVGTREGRAAGATPRSGLHEDALSHKEAIGR